MTKETASSTNTDGDEQFQLALSTVLEEYKVLTAGKPNMTVEEAIEIREYIRKRTDLEKPDDSLTPDQKGVTPTFVQPSAK